MKKIVALILVVVFCIGFVSCGDDPDGIYYSGDIKSGTYIKCEFDGNKITMESYVSGKKSESTSIEGEYEIDGGFLVIRYENDKNEAVEVIKDFEILDEKSIKIDSLIFYSES